MPLVGEIPRAGWLRKIVNDETLLTTRDPQVSESEASRPGNADVKLVVRYTNTTGSTTERVLFAHAAVLKAASRVFERILSVERPRCGFDLILVEDDPSIFEIVMKWMYGKPVEVTTALISFWAKTGHCPVLQLARKLECANLEKALRDLFMQAAGQGTPSLTWALLVVCHYHELVPEFERCCAEIARNAGTVDWVKEALLAGIPIDAFGRLVNFSNWQLDGESELVRIICRWLTTNTWVAADASAHISNWDIRWPWVDVDIMQELHALKVIPESLVELSRAWVSHLQGERTSLRRTSQINLGDGEQSLTPSDAKALKKKGRRASQNPGASGTPTNHEAGVGSSSTSPLARRGSVIAEVEPLMLPPEVEQWLGQIPPSYSPKAGKTTKEQKELLSNNLVELRTTQKLLQSSFRTPRRRKANKDIENPPEPDRDGHKMFQQRRCFHTHVTKPEENDAALMRQCAFQDGRFVISPHPPSAVVGSQTAIRLYGTRAVSKGKHEVLVRILKTNERSTEYNKLEGLRIGFATPEQSGKVEHTLIHMTTALVAVKDAVPPNLPPLLTRDIVMLLSWDCKSKKIHHAISQVVYEPGSPEDIGLSGSAAFFERHRFLGRWSKAEKLNEDLSDLNTKVAGPARFCIEIDIRSLMSGRASNPVESQVTIEILPPKALDPSWWIDLMKRTVDMQPRPDHDKISVS